MGARDPILIVDDDAELPEDEALRRCLTHLQDNAIRCGGRPS